jgi:hypothetical protein
MTAEASRQIVPRHALVLALMTDDPWEERVQLMRSIGSDRRLLESARAHYDSVSPDRPEDHDARRACFPLGQALLAR